MMSWFKWKKHDESKATALAVAPAREPRVPFESWVNDVVTGQQNIFRPLIYSFAHKALPEAFFMNHPTLEEALGRQPADGLALLHIWSKTALLCESYGLWPEDLCLSDECSGYLQSQLGQVSVTPFTREHVGLWVVKMPTPIVDPEAVFVGLCRNLHLQYQYGVPEEQSRYFTLERSDNGQATCLCEWTRDGVHHNMGRIECRSIEDFAESVFAALEVDD